MGFRPCIDLHAGKVKQIVGSSLIDEENEGTQSSTSPSTAKKEKIGSQLQTNFESEKNASEYATLYQNDGLTGGHIIMLGSGCKEQCISALNAYPGGFQVGGGINPNNALEYLNAGASHVIVTSYIFRDGNLDFARLEELVAIVGKERLVIDLSCRKRKLTGSEQDQSTRDKSERENLKLNISDDQKITSEAYFVVMDKWQTFTDYEVNEENLKRLAQYCDEFLVHGVDVEGKRCGILQDLVQSLGIWSSIPVTYAGGARSIEDLELVNILGQGKVHITVGSALDIFGGDLKYDAVVEWHKISSAKVNL